MEMRIEWGLVVGSSLSGDWGVVVVRRGLGRRREREEEERGERRSEGEKKKRGDHHRQAPALSTTAFSAGVLVHS
jgi:hypothetical protein